MGRSRYNYSLATLVLEYGNKEWPNLQDNPQPGLFFRGYLLAQAFFLLPQLRSEILAKILRLKHLTDLKLGAAIERGSLQPLDCLFHRSHLP